MRRFVITVMYSDGGSFTTNLMDYQFKLFPTYREVINAFLEKFPNAMNVAILSIMEFSTEDYKRFVSDK